MKEELEKILQNNNWYKVSKLKDLKGSCCPESELEVLDGDFIKDKFASYLKIASGSSCDAIYFQDNKIFLLEMKSFENTKEEFERNSKGFNCYDKFFENWLKNSFEKKIENKIIDTGFFILTLFGLFNSPKDCFQHFLDNKKRKIKINFIFITDLSKEKFTQLELVYANKFKYKFLDKVSFALPEDIAEYLKN
jgi:hypothetical protein